MNLADYISIEDGWSGHNDTPPFGVPLICRNSYYGGWEVFEAIAKEYKKPKPGQSPRAFRKGYRFIMENGTVVQRRDVDSWRLPPVDKSGGT